MLRLVSLRDPATYVTALLGLGLLIGVQLLSTKVWSPIAAEIAQRWHPAITIRGKNFLESSILVEMMALQIERELPDVPVERDHYHYKNMLSVYPELLDEEKGLDLYPEYSATLLANFLDKTPRRGASASETADEINELLEERNAPVVFLQPFGYTNNYEIAMRKDRADCLLRLSGQDGQYTLRALATASQKQTGMKTCLKRDGPLLFGSSSDFEKRKDGLRILSNGPKAGYGVRIRWSHHVDHDDIYKALRSGQIDVADGYAADPELQPGREEFVMLADVDGRFPDYWPAPLIRRAMLERYPGVRAALEKLTRNEKIDQKLITELTEEAMRWGLDDDLDRDKPGPYARDHLRLLVEERLVNEGILEPRD